MAVSRRQMRKKKITISVLKEAFIDLILENNDIDDITISEITAHADLNRGTFYIHFGNKIELIEVMYNDAIEGLRQALILPYKDTNRVLLDGVVPSTSLIFDHIEENKKLFKALSLIEAKPNLYSRLSDMWWEQFTTEIQFEREMELSKTDYEIFLSYQMNATLGVIKYWITNDFVYSAASMAKQLTSFYSDKVVAMKIKK